MTDQAENPRAVAGSNSVSGDEIKSFLDRVERLEDEKAVITTDIREVFAEAKGRGFDVKILRELLKLRKADADALAEHRALLELYGRAIGLTVFD